MEIVIIGSFRDMNMSRFIYTLLKIICIISTAAVIIIYMIQSTKVGKKPFAIYDYFYIHYIVTRIWSYLMGILIIAKAYFLYKENKLIYCIGLLLTGLLVIIFSNYVTSFLLFPFYNA